MFFRRRPRRRTVMVPARRGQRELGRPRLAAHSRVRQRQGMRSASCRGGRGHCVASATGPRRWHTKVQLLPPAMRTCTAPDAYAGSSGSLALCSASVCPSNAAGERRPTGTGLRRYKKAYAVGRPLHWLVRPGVWHCKTRLHSCLGTARWNGPRNNSGNPTAWKKIANSDLPQLFLYVKHSQIREKIK
jgi:hypothetical protein